MADKLKFCNLLTKVYLKCLGDFCVTCMIYEHKSFALVITNNSLSFFSTAYTPKKFRPCFAGKFPVLFFYFSLIVFIDLKILD
nr:MAG TPA: hypothetical protein [Caudoviricetes sp.]